MKRNKYIIAIALFLVGAIISGVMVFRAYGQDAIREEEFQDLSKIVEEEKQNATPPPENSNTPEHETHNPYAILSEQNKDFVGWMSIEKTTFDYPVMHTPDRPDYYLKRNFEKEYSDFGVPYVAEGCNLTESDNITIYGHNMQGQKMFGVLENYKDKSFYESHNIITFNTLQDRNVYEVVSVFRTVVYQEESFKYYEFINAENQAPEQILSKLTHGLKHD